MKCAACVTQADDAASVLPFENENTLRCHITLQHVFWIPFECILCPMTLLPTETALKQHYGQVHPKSVPKAIYTFEEQKKMEVERIMALSIGPLINNSAFCKQEMFKELQGRDVQSVTDKSSNVATPSTDISFAQADSLTHNDTQPQNNRPQCKRRSTYDDCLDSQMARKKEERRENEAKTSDSLPAEKKAPIELGSPKPRTQTACAKTVKPERTIVVSLCNNQLRSNKMRKTPTPATSSYGCRLCGDKLQSGSKTIRKQHIWRRHMPRAPIQCRLCSWKLYAFTRVPIHQDTHIRIEHPEVDGAPLQLSFKDYRQKLDDKFRRKFQRAFDDTKQPQRTRQNPTPKRSCNLCQQRVGAKSEGTHIWQHHMLLKRFACNVCTFSTTYKKLITTHGRNEHGKNGCCWSDKNAELKQEYNRIFLLAFKQPSGSGGESRKDKNTPKMEEPKKGQLACTLCHKRLLKKNTCDHIWRNHMFSQRFACHMCGYATNCLAMMKKHAKCRHIRSDICWNDKMNELQQDYQLLSDRAFGNATTISKTESEPIQQRQRQINKNNKKQSVSSKVSDTNNPQIECTLCHMTVNEKGRHIWIHHLDQKRYRCTLCSYSTQRYFAIVVHAKREHKSTKGVCWADHTEEMLPCYQTIYNRAFGSYLNGSSRRSVADKSDTKVTDRKSDTVANENVGTVTTGRESLKQKLQCNSCKKQLGGHNHKGEHIWSWHMTPKRYVCTLCDYKCALPGAAKNHAKSQHNGTNVKKCMTDHTAQLQDEYSREFQAAFGSYNKNK